MRSPRFFSRATRLFLTAVLALSAGVSQGLLPCGPFLDMIAADPFCPYVLEIFTLGITTGTTPTTYDPSSNVTRLQMAAFLSRTVDGVLKRGSRRAALNQFWALQTTTFVDVTTVGATPYLPAPDGSDVWVPNLGDGTVSRVRASDGRLLETWTGAGFALGALWALGRVFVTGFASPGKLYRILPRETAGAVTTVATSVGNQPVQLTFDGGRIWTANQGGSVSILTPGTWTVTTVTAGFNVPVGILFDGTNVWVTDGGSATLLKLNSSAVVLQTVTVGVQPGFSVFDGANIWVPSQASNSVSVVRASNGAVLTTLTGNGLSVPSAAAFDGLRVLVANAGGSGSVSLWKAADLTEIGNTLLGGSARGACSDGVNFWITLQGEAKIARY